MDVQAEASLAQVEPAARCGAREVEGVHRTAREVQPAVVVVEGQSEASKYRASDQRYAWRDTGHVLQFVRPEPHEVDPSKRDLVFLPQANPSDHFALGTF